MGPWVEVILRFRGFADRLYEVARDAAMRRQLAKLRVEQRAEESKWGTGPGRAVQVDPMKPMLKPPGTKRFKSEI